MGNVLAAMVSSALAALNERSGKAAKEREPEAAVNRDVAASDVAGRVERGRCEARSRQLFSSDLLMSGEAMSAARKITVELSSQAAELIDRKLERGEFSSASEIIDEGLQALRQREIDEDDWLRKEVLPAYDAYLANPSDVIPIDEAFSGLEEAYLKRKGLKP